MKQNGYKFHCWDGPEAFPPCITIFSAPCYSNSDNEAAVMIADGTGVDIRTFEARQDKPYALPDNEDALSVFQPRLQGLVLDAIYNILKFTMGTQSRTMRHALKRENFSVDEGYLQTVIAASKAQQPEEEKQPSARSEK